MYISRKHDRIIEDSEAFMYACGKIEDGFEEDKQAFMDIIESYNTFEKIREEIINYYFSGEDWEYEEG